MTTAHNNKQTLRKISFIEVTFKLQWLAEKFLYPFFNIETVDEIALKR